MEIQFCNKRLEELRLQAVDAKEKYEKAKLLSLQQPSELTQQNAAIAKKTMQEAQKEILTALDINDAMQKALMDACNETPEQER
jgi:PBP1b-binding outer membrane lipoprotein LpoB